MAGHVVCIPKELQPIALASAISKPTRQTVKKLLLTTESTGFFLGGPSPKVNMTTKPSRVWLKIIKELGLQGF